MGSTAANGADLTCHQASRKNLYYLLHRISQLIRLFPSVVKRERSTCGGGHIEKLHHRLGTVVASADRDALLVEDGSDVVRVDIFYLEREDARLFRGGADYSHADRKSTRLNSSH